MSWTRNLICPVLRTTTDPVKATVKRVAVLKDGGYKLTLSILSLGGERIHAYRVSEEAYREALSPEEGETLPEEIPTSRTTRICSRH